eukprot:gnl/Dysnectes_brevis/9496_a17690_112.p1 GENE.gnl/Dysnectes_brevis/9496_a17690_112~~gnl/Dysnectes_brevis/9496_a17690_112.p1  ORF type:complete len:477 (-),score=141.38 gnl/Dysnectes_brevis/9496_a17690_112:96-1526(-)
MSFNLTQATKKPAGAPTPTGATAAKGGWGAPKTAATGGWGAKPAGAATGGAAKTGWGAGAATGGAKTGAKGWGAGAGTGAKTGGWGAGAATGAKTGGWGATGGLKTGQWGAGAAGGQSGWAKPTREPAKVGAVDKTLGPRDDGLSSYGLTIPTQPSAAASAASAPSAAADLRQTNVHYERHHSVNAMSVTQKIGRCYQRDQVECPFKHIFYNFYDPSNPSTLHSAHTDATSTAAKPAKGGWGSGTTGGWGSKSTGGWGAKTGASKWGTGAAKTGTGSTWGTKKAAGDTPAVPAGKVSVTLQPPKGFDQASWEVALRHNPDPQRRIPVLAVTFPDLLLRASLQEQETAAHKQVAVDLASRAAKLKLSSAATHEQLRSAMLIQRQLSRKLVRLTRAAKEDPEALLRFREIYRRYLADPRAGLHVRMQMAKRAVERGRPDMRLDSLPSDVVADVKSHLAMQTQSLTVLTQQVQRLREQQ